MPTRPRIENARLLRRNQTSSEIQMWSLLRDRRLKDYKFRRQHPIDRYVADFACVSARLIVELDGPIHDETIEQDRVRDEFLTDNGWQIIRFSNAELGRESDFVVSQLLARLERPASE